MYKFSRASCLAAGAAVPLSLRHHRHRTGLHAQEVAVGQREGQEHGRELPSSAWSLDIVTTVLLSTPSVVQIWNYGVRQSMYSLPIPLAGHCVVVLFNRRVVFLGGGEVVFSAECSTVQYNAVQCNAVQYSCWNDDNTQARRSSARKTTPPSR